MYKLNLMNQYFALFLLLIFPVLSIAQELEIPKQSVYQVRDKMELQTLNGKWKFKYIENKDIPSSLSGFVESNFDDSTWDYITVPSNWETEGFKTPQYGADIVESWGLYRTTFKANPVWKNRHVILRFDGVQFGYEVYVNGHYAGRWGSSFNPCQFDITSFLHFDRPNVLAVKVSTRTKGWRFDLNDCWALAGIFRDVELFSVPNLHLKDVTFVSKLEGNERAALTFNVDVAAFKTLDDSEQYRAQVLFYDKTGRHLFSSSQPIVLKENGQSLQFDWRLQNPHLWTAETPYLYRMEVRIVDSRNSVVQQISENVGVREVLVKDGILLVNNTPVLLRGTCHNEIDPVHGRALTTADRLKQLQMMKAANVNFIRTAHYPFHPEFHKMCDEMGFYVCCEVPFGYGDSNLYKEEYTTELCTRAEATLTRDKNHPSIIMWTIGNENPYTEVVEKVVQYVKQKDPTRPRALPMAGNYFLENRERLSDNLDIYAFHYQSAQTVARIADLKQKPVITTEYSHALGLAFDALESQFDTILSRKNIAGGAVWCWSDQALLRNRTKNDFMCDSVPMGVWLDSLRYLDSYNDKGTDGIVYADGYPQEDYWQLRKIYSPIVVLDKEFGIHEGKQIIELTVENRFNFISLVGYRCNWQIRNLSKELGNGSVQLSALAGQQEKISLQCILPADIENNDCMLYLEVTDNRGAPVYEKSIPLLVDNQRPDYLKLVGHLPEQKRFRIQKSSAMLSVQGEDYLFAVDKNGKVTIQDTDKRKVMDTYLYLRVGRKPSINIVNFLMRKKTFGWEPYLLTPEVKKFDCMEEKGKVSARLHCRWSRVDKAGEYIEGDVIFSVTKNGVMTVDYDLVPYHTTGTLWECGPTFALHPSIETFRWLGNGPYTSTPSKTAYNERDTWALHKDDMHFMGNRGLVDAAVLLDNENKGIGYIGSSSDLAVEKIGDAIYITDNAIVSSYGTKLSQPVVNNKADKVKNIKGKFNLMLVGKAGNMLLTPLFSPYSEVLPNMHFLKSYGH